MIEISEAEILDIADHAVRSLIKRLGLWDAVSEQDVDDMRQESALRLLALSKRDVQINSDVRGYLFVAARHAAQQFIFWWRRGIRQDYWFPGTNRNRKERRDRVQVLSLDALEEAGFQAREPERERQAEPLPAEQNAVLFNLFYRSRRKRGDRGMAAAIRDTQIVNCVVMGYTNTGIAVEIGSDRHSVSHYRLSIQARLRNYARSLAAGD